MAAPMKGRMITSATQPTVAPVETCWRKTSTIVPTTTTSSIPATIHPISVMVVPSRLSPHDRQGPILGPARTFGKRAHRCPLGMWAPGRERRTGLDSRPQRLLAERVAEAACLCRREVETEHLHVGAAQLQLEPVRRGPGAEDEE